MIVEHNGQIFIAKALLSSVKQNESDCRQSI